MVIFEGVEFQVQYTVCDSGKEKEGERKACCMSVFQGQQYVFTRGLTRAFFLSSGTIPEISERLHQLISGRNKRETTFGGQGPRGHPKEANWRLEDIREVEKGIKDEMQQKAGYVVKLAV